jgi:hypothetical protein
LTEINTDPPVINPTIVHLLKRALACLGRLELNKSIAQAIPGLVVTDYFSRRHGSEARKNRVQIFILCNRVEIANKQDIVWWLHLGVRNVSETLKDHGIGTRFFRADRLLELYRVQSFIQRNPGIL